MLFTAKQTISANAYIKVMFMNGNLFDNFFEIADDKYVIASKDPVST